MGDQQRFRARLYRVGMNYCVDVPDEVGRRLIADRPTRYLGVAGEVGRQSFRTRLTPRGDRKYRLFLNGTVRAATGVTTGDSVDVIVWRDREPPRLALPTDLASALADLEGGRDAFDAMTEAQRRGMIAFLERARTQPTRARYLARVLDNVRARMAQRRR